MSSQEPTPLVKYVWSTPNAEQLVADMARVSAPENIGNDASRLLAYLIKHQHWSPYEMVNMCVEINTTRDIARQLLRHRSFSFQEFSQRYAEVDKLPPAPLREARLQDTKNRQNSLDTDNPLLNEWWELNQRHLLEHAATVYQGALANGIAKEVARAVLPEGLTSSKMYMNGTLRSWIHFYHLRSGNGTQRECQAIALEVGTILSNLFPMVWGTLNDKNT
jgi:thymidylate synthase (FAD)